jgi:MFS transporter, DHA2 family, multidrug resistance protein
MRRHLDGAIVQSIFGALLTAGYASAFSVAIAVSPDKQQITDSVQNQLNKSFSSAEDVAKQYPQYSEQISAGARSPHFSRAINGHTRLG